MLLSTEWVKTNFLEWHQYFIDEFNEPSEELLQSEMTLAEAEFSRYVKTTETDMSEFLKLQLLNIVKKRGFDRLHLSESFEFPPRVIADYEETIKTLDYINRGLLNSSGEGKGIKVKRKTKTEWFHP